MRRRWAVPLLLALGLVGAAGAAGAGGSDAAEPGLVRAEPARLGDQLVCRLQTVGLPGAKQLQSMRSGLDAAVELELAVVDEQDRLLGGRSLSLRMGFDLWEEVFSVRADGRERRFATLADLQAYLADLKGLVVAPAALVPGTGRVRLEVGLVLHAIAPDERQRVEDVIAGGPRRREGQDQQEASVSLGRLIRVFYKGGRGDQEGLSLGSGWFTREGLPVAAH